MFTADVVFSSPLWFPYFARSAITASKVNDYGAQSIDTGNRQAEILLYELV